MGPRPEAITGAPLSDQPCARVICLLFTVRPFTRLVHVWSMLLGLGAVASVAVRESLCSLRSSLNACRCAGSRRAPMRPAAWIGAAVGR
ncbi:respiratory nitrate reductase subunit gamma [Streptomyces olivaceoviridis]|uniref:respiratory nitrate reductase subunit gamma n=1 Tax=Streptomyces olivaceoviridis TaxID=1921 RepID=UPI001E64CF7B|nr:respiratory nitrate reductase subunit gamma [Streptomyces olivaceoviridis]